MNVSRITSGLLALCLVAMLAVPAQAAFLGSVFHDYGTGTEKVDPAGNDFVGTDYVLVSDQSSQRFSDSFDLSGLHYDTVDYFTLTLTFSNTDDALLVFKEDWRMRPGDSSSLLDINRVGGTATSQVFTINASVDTFSQMVAAEEFYLWFAEEAFGSNNFKVFDAKVDVYGTAATPLPGAIWLLGSGIVGLAGIRRKMKA